MTIRERAEEIISIFRNRGDWEHSTEPYRKMVISQLKAAIRDSRKRQGKKS